ncbi:Uncharacterised protein [Metamycoplasma arthritidis]|uniref:Uncharacterized protein n=1 Tax=Metamycoplasma arthritidis (strain 158L3-1) TaxID=243272 RepID=B3PN70_META1|nr:hypothetical protein [Metamycoplasma arthritidis]ACF07472.1 conserved hypothetical protein [Metamycoplasma arthritidis 158L3-1]VEU78993.1 Uncharacterised protein [Metamycoplasma arthritidis]
MNNSSKKKSSFSLWAILGITFSSLLLIGAIIFVIFITFGFFKNANPFLPPILSNKESQAISYNQKNYNSDEEKFEYGNLSIKEYPYAERNGKLLYFLGKDGLKKLNEDFLKRASYGSEINSLKAVYINKKNSSVDSKNLNGYYLPNTQELYIPIDNFMKLWPNINWENVDLDYKIELIISTLVHEYMHHVATTYNQANLRSDKNSDTSLIYQLNPQPIFSQTYSNNKKFLDEFRKNLGYVEPKYGGEYLKNSSEFSTNYGLPVFREFSSYDLFKYANLIPDDERFNKINSGQYFFNNNRNLGLEYQSPISNEQIKYLYSLEELIPREYLKMSFQKKYNLPNQERFTHFVNNGRPYLTAFGDDIVKQIAHGSSRTQLWRNLYSYNWVFDRELKDFKNVQGRYPYQVTPTNADARLKGLFKAYLDLMGYGQGINYFGFNDQDHKKANLGGFAKLSEEESKKKAYLLVSNLNNPSAVSERIKANIYRPNFFTKKNWDDKVGDPINRPSFVGLEDNLYSFYTDSFDLDRFINYTKNTKVDLKLWIDSNDNGIQDASDKVIDLTDENNFKRFSETKRTITNFRKYMEWNSTNPMIKPFYNKSYKIELNKDVSGHYYTVSQYTN